MQPVSSDAPAYPDESSAKIPKTPCGTVKRVSGGFSPHAADSGGLSLPWLRVWSADAHQGLFVPLPDVHAMTIFGGSLEYITVSMLLIFGLCDETFSITCSSDVPPEVDRGWFYLWVTVLDWCYWGAGATVLLHIWRRQMLLSIAGGTIVYMLLVQMM